MSYSGKSKEELIIELEELNNKYNYLKKVFEVDAKNRKKLEKDELFSYMFLKSPVATILTVPYDGIILDVNETFIRESEYSRDELIGNSIVTLNFFDDLNNREDIFSALKEKGYLNDYEICFRKKSGKKHFGLLSVVFIKIDNKLSLLSTIIDITERKLIAEELKKSEDKFRKAFYTTPDSVVISRLEDGVIVSINKGFTQIMEYTEEEVKGKSASELNIWHNPEDREKLKNRLKTDGFVENFEAIFCSKSGEMGYGLMSAAIIDFDGEPHTINITRDIRNRKKMEDELIKAKEKAEESDHLKTAFLQNMSHEIRTPLNAIMGFSGLLPKRFNNKPKLEEYTKLIIQRGDDLLDIINGILDIAKIESGHLPIYSEECNITIWFDELLALCKEIQKRQDKQHLKLNIITNFIPSDTVIYVDKGKLKQIFLNLVTNAFKFTDNGEINFGCFLNKESKITFYVSDTGIGIPADKHEIIFERFTKLSYTTNHTIAGTGLGLSIVKGLVNLMGGEIWLESELNKGTTFYFTLNYKVANTIYYEPVKANQDVMYDFSGKNILLVEDDLYNAHYLKEILAEAGFNIIHVTSGQQSIEISSKNTFDVILMDIGLPDIKGYEAIKQISIQNPNLKIIAQTAYASPMDKKEAFDSGCVNYISKPIEAGHLLTMLDKHLSR